MRLRRATNYLLQHRAMALLLTFFITFIPVIGILGVLISGFITLVKGVKEGLLFTMAATLPYFVSFYVSSGPDAGIPLAVWAAIGVAVLSNFLTWIFAVMLRQKTSLSVILQIAALVGVLVISIVHLAYPSVVEWWGTQLNSYYHQAQVMAGTFQHSVSSSSKLQLESINKAKHSATGLMIAAVLFNAIFQLIMSRWWQAIIYKPGSLRHELQGIRLSQLAGILFVISLTFSYLGNSVISDIMPVLYMLFGVAGLSLVHYLFGLVNAPMGWFWLSVFYLTLIFTLSTSLVVISILGLLDIWLDARKRFKHV